MSAKQVETSIEIEDKAEKALDDARKRAGDIVLKAKDEAARILSAEVFLDEVKEESDQILGEAKKQADKEVDGSRKQASDIRTGAGKKAGKIAERIVNIIVGAK